MDTSAFAERHQLPDSFNRLARQWYEPLCQRLQRSTVRLLGINGCQGSGKSTLADYIAESYRSVGRQVAVVSIDDLYLTAAERHLKAESVHPLFATRGVPGTHDCELGIQKLDELLNLKAGESCSVPRFDKLADDRLHETLWQRYEGPIDLVVFEGWCVGSVPESAVALHRPVNELEASEDREGLWRQAVNADLAAEYAALFSRIDALLLLKAPGFECVKRWRGEQEARMVARLGSGAVTGMNDVALERFIQHYERLTRHNLAALPGRADVVLELNGSRNITGALYQSRQHAALSGAAQRAASTVRSQPLRKKKVDSSVSADTAVDKPVNKRSSKPINKLWVVTDLDGTLLDHDNYSYAAASEALHSLQRQGVPVILNTSKTYAEVQPLVKELNLKTPFIVENGAAAYIPANWPQPLCTLPVAKSAVGERKMIFGKPRSAVLAVLQELRKNDQYRFVGFADMTAEEVMACTGLSSGGAARAANRDYSEPLLWKGDEAALEAFCTEVRRRRLTVTQGGRFIHIAAAADKGTAMRWLASNLSGTTEPFIIALGDSENDLPMLKAANYAVVIKRPHKPDLTFKHACQLTTSACGPEGWQQAIDCIMDELAPRISIQVTRTPRHYS